jgi:cobalt ECF transporter T component CbiQ
MVGGFFDINEAGAKKKIIKSPKVRVSFFLILLCLAASFNHYIALGIISIIALYLCLWTRIKFTYILLRMLLLIPFGLGAIILLPFSVENKDIVIFFGWTISSEGLSTALMLVSKLLLCHIIICLLLATTTPTELFTALHQLGIPKVLVEIMQITLRYMAVLFEEIERMMIAQQSRGLTFRSFSSLRSYQRSGELLGVLFLRSYLRSVRIHEAMISRKADVKGASSNGSN